MSFQLHSKITIYENEPLAKHSSFKIGGNAFLYAEPKTKDEVVGISEFAQEEDLPIFVMGNGTNLLFSDAGYPGIVLSMRKYETELLDCRGDRLCVSSGISLPTLVVRAKERGLGGLAFLAWIPGTLGGAIMRNASYSIDGQTLAIADVLVSVDVFDPRTRECSTLSKEQLRFGYRYCDGIDGVILDATLAVRPDTPASIENKIAQSHKHRTVCQDLDSPSVGCIFKNPPNAEYTAGQMIDMCGLKGSRVGGAMISNKHANFILNQDNATAKDVLHLVQTIKQAVRGKFGVDLTLEVEYVS